jgi:hypothetical protein
MPKVVIYLFHADDDSMTAGSHVAERVRQVMEEQGTDLEVFCFGPAQRALTGGSDNPVHVEYNRQLDELIAAGVPVGACLNAAKSAGTDAGLSARGFALQFARDAFVRYALEGATVMSF